MGYTNYTWNVDMLVGHVSNVFNKVHYSYVWPVRGGQSGALGSLTLSPSSKDYGSVVTNATSAAQTFTLLNSGTGNLVISAITLTGADSGMFTLNVGDGTAGTCGATPTIAAAGSCTVSATFTPTLGGSKAASLRVGTNDLPTANTYSALNGTGLFSIGTSVVGGNGTITCDSPVTLGGTSNCTVSAITAGYHLATFTDNTVDKLASVVANAYSITNVTADHTVAGTFAIDTHTVTFNSNGGSAVASQSVNYNATATSPTAPTKTGYTFAGWYSDAALTNVFAFTTVITADTTLYAKWAILSYTLNFVAGSNGSLTGIVSQSITYNNSASAVTAVPATGYHFVNWTGTGGFATTTSNPLTVSNVAAAQDITANFAIDAVTEVPVSQPHDGILNPASGKTDPDISDALEVLQYVMGMGTLSDAQKASADISPLGSDGKPVGKGYVDVGDVVLIMRRIVGAVTW